MDEMRVMPTGSERFRGAQSVGNVPAERCLFPQPGDLRQTLGAPSGENES